MEINLCIEFSRVLPDSFNLADLPLVLVYHLCVLTSNFLHSLHSHQTPSSTTFLSSVCYSSFCFVLFFYGLNPNFMNS